MNIFKNLVTGRYSLARTFWGFGIGGYFIINIIILIVLNLKALSPLQAIYVKGGLRLALAITVSLSLLAIYRRTLSVWSVVALLVFVVSAILNAILLFQMLTL